jgi:hypothetical protein
MAGPLPDERSRRRNAPTIPTTKLPVRGRKGRPPNPPTGYEFGPAGKAWWTWAWTTPQAMAWSAGDHYFIARRAQLEDHLQTLADFEGRDIKRLLEELLDPESEVDLVLATTRLRFVIGNLKALAGGELGVMKEQRELENRLGLNPKALADLRWAIVDDTAEDAKGGAAKTASKSKARKTGQPKPGDRRSRLVGLPGGAAAAS